MRRFTIIALIILLSIFVLVGVGLFYLPHYAKDNLEESIYENLGRRAAVTDLRINYTNFELEIDDMVVYDADSITPFVGFAGLVTDAEPFLLFKKEIRVKKFYIDSFYIHFRQEENNRFNFSDLLEFSAEDSLANDTLEVVEEALPDLGGYNLIVEDFQLTRSLISYEDKAIDQYAEVNDINMKLPEFRWDNQQSQIGIELHFAQGGDATFQLETDLKDKRYRFDTSLDNVDLAVLTPSIKKYSDLKFSDFKGMFSGSMQILGNPFKPVSSVVSGEVNMDNFAFRSTEGKRLIRFDRMQLNVDSLLIDQDQYYLSRLHMTNPIVHFAQWEERDSLVHSYTTFLNLPADPLPTDDESSVSASDEYTTQQLIDEYYAYLSLLRIDTVSIQNGAIHYLDSTYSTPLHLSFTNLIAEGFMKPEQKQMSTLRSTTKVNSLGSSVINLKLENGKKEKIDLNFEIEELSASDLSPIFLDLFGRNVVSGKVDVKIDSELTGDNVDADFMFRLNTIKLSDKVKKGEYNVPIKLVLGLLQDGKGHVVLDGKITGNPDDPNFDVKRAIMRSVKNSLVNIAKAPFAFVGKLLGMQEKDLSQLNYAYGDTIISDTRSMKALAKLLNKKPEMMIEFTQLVNERVEKQEIANQMALLRMQQELATDTIGFDFLKIKLQSTLNSESDSLEILTSQWMDNTIVEQEFQKRQELRNQYVQSFFAEDSIIGNRVIVKSLPKEEFTPAAAKNIFSVKLDFD